MNQLSLSRIAGSFVYYGAGVDGYKRSPSHLKICMTVNKEKGFTKRCLKNPCMNIPVNKL